MPAEIQEPVKPDGMLHIFNQEKCTSPFPLNAFDVGISPILQVAGRCYPIGRDKSVGGFAQYFNWDYATCTVLRSDVTVPL